MPFGVANAPALFQELMNKILSILRRRPKVQELISRGAQMEAHIDDVCLGTNTQEDHLILLGEFFAVCQENLTRLKLEKCEFMQETMQFLAQPCLSFGFARRVVCVCACVCAVSLCTCRAFLLVASRP